MNLHFENTAKFYCDLRSFECAGKRKMLNVCGKMFLVLHRLHAVILTSFYMRVRPSAACF